ncbi:dual specificity phosphatase [Apiospora arundinis]|uniref:Protein-tyrosine phosphatase-like protein n=1 Tax=Apiospora arundinis TaxID=335852 RepID=A0ABR2ISU1_9PEZI
MADFEATPPASIQQRPYQPTVPVVPYSLRPPSPPSIPIPAPALSSNSGPIKIVPSYANVDPADLTPDQLDIITGGFREQSARDITSAWKYNERRSAQAILDCLYLGPSNVARDLDWLTKNGITMLLAVRDSSMVQARLMFVDGIAQQLGIQADYVDVSGHTGMIRSLPEAVRKINNHLLDVYHRQAVPAAAGQAAEGSMLINRQDFKRGKVLVFCETGNERSPIVVIAYMMAVLGMSMVRACQFIHYRRFCVSLTDEAKFLLQTYEGLLEARRTVNQYQHAMGTTSVSPRPKLRRTADEMDEDDEQDSNTRPRPGLAPFVDSKDMDLEMAT